MVLIKNLPFEQLCLGKVFHVYMIVLIVIKHKTSCFSLLLNKCERSTVKRNVKGVGIYGRIIIAYIDFDDGLDSQFNNLKIFASTNQQENKLLRETAYVIRDVRR